jgi:transposase
MSRKRATVRKMNWVAVDVHSRSCEGGWMTDGGKEKQSWRVATSLEALREKLGMVPRPKALVIEEGPLADWLVRELSAEVDQVVVADPHRNALIARDGDKDDALDWRKLAHLARGGYVRAVHHSGDLGRSAFKQHVLLYHQRVRHKHAEAMRIVWRLRAFGIVIKEKDLKDASGRSGLVGRLPDHDLVRQDVQLLLKGYDQAAAQVARVKKRLDSEAAGIEQVKRFMELPGVKYVRASSMYAVLDTPFRFKSKQALWKYMGIGLERRQSGQGKPRLRVPRRCNRVLKNVILGAAKSAIRAGGNPFAEQYERWLGMGRSPRVAKRNTARSLATVMWGMWKSGSVYDPLRVSLPAAEAVLTEAGPRR